MSLFSNQPPQKESSLIKLLDKIEEVRGRLDDFDRDSFDKVMDDIETRNYGVERQKLREVVVAMYEFSGNVSSRFELYKHRRYKKEIEKGNDLQFSKPFTLSPIFRQAINFDSVDPDNGTYIAVPGTDFENFSFAVYMDLPCGFALKTEDENGRIVTVAYISFAVSKNKDIALSFIYTNQIQGEMTSVSKYLLNRYDYVKFFMDILEQLGKKLGVGNICIERGRENEWEKVRRIVLEGKGHSVYDIKARALGYKDSPGSVIHSKLPFSKAPRIKVLQ